jgi:isoquinoline 1-oxidoreductase beta subunit
MNQQISRRTFVQSAAAVGGGLVLGFYLPSGAEAAQVNPELWQGATGGPEINAWLTIDTNSIVTVRVPHTEMGQGAMTSVATLVAEELDIPWANVRAVLADANRHVNRGEEYVDMSTGGSNLVRNRHPHILRAGASARERLKEAAAQKWGVTRDKVVAKQGVLTSGTNKGTYGEFATAAASVKLAEEPNHKKYGDWWLLGTPVARMDVEPKVNGSAIYPMDVRLPGMVYAAVKVSPVPGGVLKSFNFDAVKARPGVIGVVEFKQTKTDLGNADLRTGVAVVADSFYRAKTALELMPIEWDFKGNDKFSYEGMTTAALDLMGKPAQQVEEVRGDPRPILASATKVLTGDYSRPYEAHATMSPPAAVADVKPNRIDVWTFTQNVSASLLQAAQEAGRDTKDVYVHGTFQGGGFGNGNGTDVTRQAVQISKQIGKPVKVIWTREEDILQTRSRPPIWARFQAVIGTDGMPTAFLSRAVGETKNPAYADRGISNMVYQIPHYRHERHVVPSNIPVGPNRAPGNNNNGFTIEQFADEMALAGGIDPLEWRIKMTQGNERWQRVLAKMKEVGGFTTKLPKGQGMGIAVVEAHGSTVGVIATVEVTRRGSLFVDKILVVHNAGWTINPRAMGDQIRSSVGWEMSHALFGGLKMQNGRMQNINFDNYKMMRMPDMPRIDVIHTDSRTDWFGGAGETAVPPTPPAIANAIFFATGKRIRSTPIIQHDLSWS